MIRKRLLVLGFDAMDIDLVRRWAAAGFLPTFRRLFETAAWTDFLHTPDITSGAVFPCLHTGRSPLANHAPQYMHLREGSYRLRRGAGAEIKGDPFWKHFADQGWRIVLGELPFMTPDPVWGGKQFWGWGVHDAWTGNGPASVPATLYADLCARFGQYPIRSCVDYSTATDSLKRLKSGLLTGIERRTAILKSLLSSNDWDLFYAVYGESHCGGHVFWHLEDESHPAHDAGQVAEVGHALREVYAALDRGLGELLEGAGDDVTVVVFCSHGMGPNHHAAHLFPELVRRFLQRWQGGDSVARDDTLPASRGGFDGLWRATVQRLPPAWRLTVRDRLPRSLRSLLYRKRLDRSREWSRMAAFPLPIDGLSMLRVNLAGRDPNGIIRPGEEYRRFVDLLVRELQRLVNADGGEPAVERIFRADQAVDPLSLGPDGDLLIWWSRSRPIRSLRSPSLGTISGECEDMRTGEHVMRGLLLVSHPLARAGRCALADVSAADIPVTLCHLAGIDPGSAMVGRNRWPELRAR